MASYKKSIGKLESLRTKNNNAIKNQTEHLGRQIAALDVVEGTGYAEAVDRIHTTESTIQEKERTIETWNELSDELDTIDDAMRQIAAQVSGKRVELEPLYETIGEAAVELYVSNPSRYTSFAELAEQFVSIEDGIRNRERELQSLETGERQESFIGKTIAKGKGMVLRGSLKSKGNQRSRALRDIGERVCAVDLEGDVVDAEGAADVELARALLPARTILDDLKRLAEENRQLEENRNEVEKRRLEIEKRERMRNPVRNLGHEVERLKTELADQALELGNAYREADSRLDGVGEAVSATIETIERLDAENKRAEAVIRRLEAAIAVERIGEQIESKQENRNRLEAEIASIDSSVSELKSEKTARTKARGSVASLEAEVAELIGSPDTEAADETDATTTDSSIS